MTTTNTTAHQPSLNPESSPKGYTPAPEPGPDWPIAKRQWGLAWELHWIGLGLAYALLACRSLWAIIRSPDVNSFARKRLYQAINWLLVALGTTRSLYLWIDPYESGENIVRCPLWIVRPLFGIAFPCLMSAFCLVHVAFLEVAKIHIGLPKLTRLRFVVSIIFVHFAVVIVSDTTTAIKADRTELLIVCQTFFIVWGLLNSICFIYSGSRVVRKAHHIRNNICVAECIQNEGQPSDCCSSEKMHAFKNKETAKHEENRPRLNRSGARDTSTMQPPGFGNHLTVESAKQKASKALKQKTKPTPPHKKPSLPTCGERAIQKVARITLVTSALSIACCALQIYSLFGVFSVYSKIESPKPWPWLVFQTSFRLVELSMAYTLSYCVLRSGFGGRRGIRPFLICLRRMRRRRAPRITIMQAKDVEHGDLP